MTQPKRPGPPERSQTVRQALRQALDGEASRTAKELSAEVGIPEKEVATHLSHLERSMKKEGRRLKVTPARCVECDFSFAKRDRLTRPATCPVCKSIRIEPQRFRIE